MNLNGINLLKRLNGSFLFLFFILFTAPLEADDVFSESLDEERRRASMGLVITKIISFDADVSAQSSLIDENPAVTVLQLTDTLTFSMEQTPGEVSWWHSYQNQQVNAELIQRSFDTVQDKTHVLNSTTSQWIGTAISETGPPAFPENVYSFLSWNESNGRLPQVAQTKIPLNYLKKITFEIDRKTASVRTPTGPPAQSIAVSALQAYQYEPDFAPSVSPVNPTKLPTARGMPVILRGIPMRFTT